SGRSVGLLRSGTLVAARDEDEARELERQLEFRRSLGLRAERLAGGEAREREPALAPGVRMALHAPDDHSVDPRAVLGSLRAAGADAGVEIRERVEVEALATDAGETRVTGVSLGGGQLLAARRVVLAAGAWSGRLRGVPEHARMPVRPVKGQIMRLR